MQSRSIAIHVSSVAVYDENMVLTLRGEGCLGTIFMHWHGAFDGLFHYLGVFLLAVGPGQRL